MLSGTLSKLRRTLTTRKRKNRPVESSSGAKPTEWLADEAKIRESFCTFVVKYLGSIEVFESRGVQVCELAIKALNKKKTFRLFRKRGHRALLTVTGDELKVSDEISKHLLVDQTIEKVSFCAPDRFNQQGFAYICRDGATRRWMCHAFLAVNDTGERLSHAVGCAFNICLEKKQQREKDALQVTFNENKTSFTRMGTFRQTTLAERLADPQMVLPQTPKESSTPLAIEYATVEKKTSILNNQLVPATSRPRPHANPLYQSTRLPSRIPEESTLRRDMSLRQADSNILTAITQGTKDDTGDLLSVDNYTPHQNQINSSDPFSAAPVDIKSIMEWQNYPVLPDSTKMTSEIQPVMPVMNFMKENRSNNLDTILEPVSKISSPKNNILQSASPSQDPFDLRWCEEPIKEESVNDISLNLLKTPTTNPVESIASSNPFL